MSQDIQHFSFSQVSQVEGGKGGAAKDHENNEKGGSNVGKDTYEYRKGREVEVRCCGIGEGEGGASRLKFELWSGEVGRSEVSKLINEIVVHT